MNAFLGVLFNWIVTGKLSKNKRVVSGLFRKKFHTAQKSHSGVSMAEVLVSIAVTGVIASLAASTVVKNNSDDWGKQTQLMMNRIAAAAYSAQLKYGKPYLTATDSNGNLIYPNGMVSLLGSLDKSVKTTTSNGITTFYYPGKLNISVGAISGNGNVDSFTAAAGTSQNQWLRISFGDGDPTTNPNVSVANGTAGYFIVPTNSQGVLTARQYAPTTYPTSSFYDTYIQQNQPKLTTVKVTDPDAVPVEVTPDTPVTGGGGCGDSLNLLALSSINLSTKNLSTQKNASYKMYAVQAEVINDCLTFY